MQRLVRSVLACATLACAESTGPSGLAGHWLGDAPVIGGFARIDMVVAANSGAFSGSGTLAIDGCPGSPFAATITGARAGAAVSFTLLPQDVNFSGAYAADSIAGMLTGLACGGVPVVSGVLVMKRYQPSPLPLSLPTAHRSPSSFHADRP